MENCTSATFPTYLQLGGMICVDQAAYVQRVREIMHDTELQILEVLKVMGKDLLRSYEASDAAAQR